MVRMNRTPSTGKEWSKIYACFIRLERRERERARNGMSREKEVWQMIKEHCGGNSRVRS